RENIIPDGTVVRYPSLMEAISEGPSRLVKLVVLSLVLAGPKPVKAQESGGQGQQSQQQQTKEKAVKQPPPPLFPKHRRGIYKNGLGLPLLDATPQSPPLET